MPRRHRSALLCALVASFVLPLCAQQSIPAPASSRLDQILPTIHRGRVISQVGVSPDGKLLAWLEAGRIFVAPFGDLDHSRKITGFLGQPCGASGFVWSPGSDAIAFLSDCADSGGQSDIFLSRLDGQPARRLSELHGEVDSPAFSPDGKRIAFLYVPGATRPANALAAEPLPSGVIGEDRIEIQRVAAVSADSPQPSAPTFLTPPSLHVFEFDWSPDSSALAYIAADPPGENNWWVAKLYTQQLAAQTTSTAGSGAPSLSSTAGAPARTTSTVGAPGPPSGTWDSSAGWEGNPKIVLSPPSVSGPLHGLQIAVPRWSPDGKSIAFIGGLMSDQGVTGGDVWVVPSAGGEPLDLTPNRAASAAWIDWAGDQELFVSELAGGNSQLVLLRLHASRGCTFSAGVHGPVFSIPATVGDGRAEMSLSAGAAHNLFVFKASSFDRPQEIYAARADSVISACAGSEEGNLTQLTHWNDSIKPAWGKAQSLTWTNGSFHIQGWLLLPLHYDPAKKYPLLVDVHGGPAAAVVSGWRGDAGSFGATVFSALDYFVLMPNPRGSYGQGEAFTQANRRDFGYGDLQDILSGVDTVLKQYPVDPNRVGILGWSYGGFMSMFAVTQTHRFRAAVAGAGISDWLSYYGENSIDQWMIPYFGDSVYQTPEIYAKSSAVNFIRNVSTPTLVVVGDRDGECPAPQSFEFWHALRDLHVPAQLVVYPGEGHGFTDSAHRLDVLERAVDWFDRYMPPGPSTP